MGCCYSEFHALCDHQTTDAFYFHYNFQYAATYLLYYFLTDRKTRTKVCDLPVVGHWFEWIHRSCFFFKRMHVRQVNKTNVNHVLHTLVLSYELITR